MDQIISKLRQKLDKFKSWINEPRLYIVNELDAIKNEIDIFAERFLMRASKSKTKSEAQIEKDHEKINSNRRQMIDEVDAFQKKVLAQMPTNELEARLTKKLTFAIEELEKYLQVLEKEPSYEKVSELENAIYSVIYELDCALKQNSSVIFIDVFLLKQSLNSHTKFNSELNMYYKYQATKFGIKQTESEMERDEKDRDEDEVVYEYPSVYVQLNAATTFGVLVILDECISREEFS